MNIPNLLQGKMVNEDGTLHPNFQNLLNQLIGEMQENLSEDGFKVPKRQTADINNLNNTKSTAAILYDNETHQFKANINGDFKVILTS